MVKVAILGKTGMLGRAVLEEFEKSDFSIIATRRQDLDAEYSFEQDVEKILKDCDYAINCIGIIKPYIHDDNFYEVQRAIKVNSLFPHKLANVAKITGTKIIQIATDCVYDGAMGNYDEGSIHNPIDVYGKTKSLGEISSETFLNLRCSIIGREEKSFLSLLEWFLNQPQNATVDGYLNHYWNGVTTNAFAKICRGIIENNLWFSGKQHILASDSPSKAGMLKIFAEVFNRQDIKIKNINAKNLINRTLMTQNKALHEKIWYSAGYSKIPTVQDMVKDLSLSKKIF